MPARWGRGLRMGAPCGCARGRGRENSCISRAQPHRLRRLIGMRLRDLTGMKFGRLTVIGLTYERRHGHRLRRTLCDCGVEKIVAGSHLTRGQTRSCGCLQAEIRWDCGVANKRSNTYRIVGDTAEIDLTKGQVAVIDAVDLPRVIDGQGKWFAHRSD